MYSSFLFIKKTIVLYYTEEIVMNVPKSCCILLNDKDEKAYLDPRPSNAAKCQVNKLKHTDRRTY